MSIMTNYIINICDFLETNNINISDYDDDLTYYDGFDDVLVIYINEEKYKFIQNYENGYYKNFTLYINNEEIKGYDEITKYLISKLNNN